MEAPRASVRTTIDSGTRPSTSVAPSRASFTREVPMGIRTSAPRSPSLSGLNRIGTPYIASELSTQTNFTRTDRRTPVLNTLGELRTQTVPSLNRLSSLPEIPLAPTERFKVPKAEKLRMHQLRRTELRAKNTKNAILFKQSQQENLRQTAGIVKSFKAAGMDHRAALQIGLNAFHKTLTPEPMAIPQTKIEQILKKRNRAEVKPVSSKKIVEKPSTRTESSIMESLEMKQIRQTAVQLATNLTKGGVKPETVRRIVAQAILPDIQRIIKPTIKTIPKPIPFVSLDRQKTKLNPESKTKTAVQTKTKQEVRPAVTTLKKVNSTKDGKEPESSSRYFVVAKDVKKEREKRAFEAAEREAKNNDGVVRVKNVAHTLQDPTPLNLISPILLSQSGVGGEVAKESITQIQDGSLLQLKDEISYIKETSLEKVKEKIREKSKNAPPVAVSTEAEDPVKSEDVERVYRPYTTLYKRPGLKS